MEGFAVCVSEACADLLKLELEPRFEVGVKELRGGRGQDKDGKGWFVMFHPDSLDWAFRLLLLYQLEYFVVCFRVCAKVEDTGGEGTLAQWVHCEFVVSFEAIHPVITQQVCGEFF